MSIVCTMRHALPLLFFLAACADIPSLEGSVTDTARTAPYPALVPLGDLPTLEAKQTADIDARIAALQRRAAVLRQTDPGALQ